MCTLVQGCSCDTCIDCRDAPRALLAHRLHMAQREIERFGGPMVIKVAEPDPLLERQVGRSPTGGLAFLEGTRPSGERRRVELVEREQGDGTSLWYMPLDFEQLPDETLELKATFPPLGRLVLLKEK